MEKNGTPRPQQKLPQETWAKNLGFASEYMEAARQKHTPPEVPDFDFIVPSRHGLERSPVRSATPKTPEEPVNVASIEKISVTRFTTGGILRFYGKLEAVDDMNIKTMYGVASKLDSTLYYLIQDLPWNLTREGDLTFGHMILDLQDSKVRLEKLLQQVLKEDSIESSSRDSRPASVTYSLGANGERRASRMCSFRQHTSMKLINSIEELKNLIDPIIDVLHS
jgi:hypothetical protein